MEETLTIIRAIEAHKHNARIQPTHALLKEVLQAGATLSGLQELTESGQIRLGDTINDKYITIIK